MRGQAARKKSNSTSYMKLPRSSFGRTSVSGSEEQRSNRCGAAILPQYPTKEVDQSVKLVPFRLAWSVTKMRHQLFSWYLNKRYQSTYKTLQYPAKEADRSVKPVSFDSPGALPGCSTNYSMDSSHRCESNRYFARVSELAYERHSECRAHMGLRVRIAPRAPPIHSASKSVPYISMRYSIQCVLVSKYALESKTSQLPMARIICIIDRRLLTR